MTDLTQIDCRFCKAPHIVMREFIGRKSLVHQVECLSCGARGPLGLDRHTALLRWQGAPVGIAGEIEG